MFRFTREGVVERRIGKESFGCRSFDCSFVYVLEALYLLAQHGHTLRTKHSILSVRILGLAHAFRRKDRNCCKYIFLLLCLAHQISLQKKRSGWE